MEASWVKDYDLKLSEDTKQAQQKQSELLASLEDGLSGIVCNYAAGRGINLKRLLAAKNKDFYIVNTDLDPHILAMTRKRLKTDDTRVFIIAADGRYMPIKDNSFDYITTLAAFGNIPETAKVVKEMYRVLKPNGELLIHGTYVDKDSKSHKLAENLGVDTGMVEEYLLCELEQAGFRGIKSTIAAKAVWAENPYDMLPIAGDMQYFYILQARK